ncbi:MAG: hypothetical protein KCHDKBKB_00731 [Elusimicrobia bacterium]|nr:hypothetical protein [Elusimicrobiota bacterium]
MDENNALATKSQMFAELKALKQNFDNQLSKSTTIDNNQYNIPKFNTPYYGDPDFDRIEKDWQPKVDDWAEKFDPYRWPKPYDDPFKKVPVPSKGLDEDIEKAIKKILADRYKKTQPLPKPKKPKVPEITPDEVFDRMVKKALEKIKAKKK